MTFVVSPQNNLVNSSLGTKKDSGQDRVDHLIDLLRAVGGRPVA